MQSVAVQDNSLFHKVPLFIKSTSVKNKRIPQFPNFKPLELSDREEIESYVRQFPPYSDFNFVSLWCFNINSEAEVSYLNDNLIIKYHDYITHMPFYTFLGLNNVIETSQVLLNFSKNNKIYSGLRLIPEIIVNKINHFVHDFRITEDKDNHDYIYSSIEHEKLIGKAYADKRTLINRFYKKIESHRILEVDISDGNVQVDIKKMYEQWLMKKGINHEEIKHERQAIENILKNIYYEDIFTILYEVNNRFVGFSISQYIHDQHVIVHFEKLDATVPGISAYIRNEFAKFINERGFVFINYEQDLGIEGLRKSKKLWNPVRYYKKYTIDIK